MISHPAPRLAAADKAPRLCQHHLTDPALEPAGSRNTPVNPENKETS